MIIQKVTQYNKIEKKPDVDLIVDQVDEEIRASVFNKLKNEIKS